MLRSTLVCGQASDVLAEQLQRQEKLAAQGQPKAAKGGADVPSLTSLFRVGQLVQAVVTDLQDGSDTGA